MIIGEKSIYHPWNSRQEVRAGSSLFLSGDFLVEFGVILALVGCELDSGPGVLVEHACQQVLRVIAPYNALFLELVHVLFDQQFF